MAEEEEDEGYLGATPIPGGGVLRLFKEGKDFTLRVQNTDLMNSIAHESEDTLAKLVCSRLTHLAEPTVLVGGLGMGFTLAAALKEVGPKARVIVAELIPGVVEWNRGLLADLAGRPLEDPRVSVRVQDIAVSLRAGREEFDGILMDVDNGPKGLTRRSNNWLYSEDGLGAAYRSLRTHGILAVWSSSAEESFAMRLQKLGFETEEIPVLSRSDEEGDLGERHTIWLATKLP